MRQRSQPSEESQPPGAAERQTVGRWLAQARRLGLLGAIPPEPWQTLCAVLSFTCRDGRPRFAAEQLALALSVPREEAERRLESLSGTPWQGQPLAEPERGADGAVVGARPAPLSLFDGIGEAAATPAPAEVPLREAHMPEAAQPFPQSLFEPESRAEAAALVRELLAVGLLPDQAERLMTQFSTERIRRQLDWLPRRAARNPAAFLLTAVANDWEAPREAL